MNRVITERLKLYEGMRIPIFSGRWYHYLMGLDNKSINSSPIDNQPINKENRRERIICSLTSYPARIQCVGLAIKSLMQQTVKPDRIILWLANEQFPNHELPESLKRLTSYGLEILWMHDIYGHKKYYYPVKNQAPDELVITFDDDIIYSPLTIERLMKTHEKYPYCLVCERGQVIDKAILDNPGCWKTISDVGVTRPTYSMNPSPGGGCLIPYGAFHPDALDESLIRQLAYKNDDLWYMFMCAENGTRMIKTRKYHKPFSVINGSQGEQMAFENVCGEFNKVAMRSLIQAYPKAWERILTDQD